VNAINELSLTLDLPDWDLVTQTNDVDCGVYCALFGYLYLHGEYMRTGDQNKDLRQFLRVSLERGFIDHAGKTTSFC